MRRKRGNMFVKACVFLGMGALVSFFLSGCQKKTDAKNLVQTETLDQADSEYPSIAANLVFFYYRDLAAAQNFYENIMGLERVLDYGFATVHRISRTTYLLSLIHI